MEVYVGTSGWMYDWNLGGDFKWYIENSNLNSVELNASFYRFPFRSQVALWSRLTRRGFRWSIKVNKFITHVYRFSEKAYNVWDRFYNLFKPLDDHIDFYLFQLPPQVLPIDKYVRRIESFISKANLNWRFAIEFRNLKWFSDEWIDWCRKLNVTMTSIDSPEILEAIFNTNGMVYLRLHGRGLTWYSYNYSIEEIENIASKITALNPHKAYIYFNNNHNMLRNAQEMFKVMLRTTKPQEKDLT